MPGAQGSRRSSTSASPNPSSTKAGPWRIAVSVAAVLILPQSAIAQSSGLQPGEGYLTRFSGVSVGTGGPVIDTGGTVGSIIDLRAPGRPPQGEHWADEPQRSPVTAGEVGQVFGVVLDDASPPNIYLSATSAFGLHTQGGQWMAGMWGKGGPGTIWRLDAATGYRPQPFAEVTTGGRPNSGAALGNMAFDKVAHQIFVSDLETGLIHRIDAASGSDLGTYDHGTTGRSRFVDADSGQTASLPPIAFDPASRARLGDCASGFDKTVECWNLAPSGRRIWGLGVRNEPGTASRRLYYAVWSGPSAGAQGWAGLSDEEKRNAVWSVGIGENGDFDTADVRREFLVPDFFVEAKDIAGAGYSRPVSDISFAECTSKPVMLVAERGGWRNLGLSAENAFAYPHEARTLRYEMDQAGKWQPVGRYDIGYWDRQKDGTPFMRANCAGGAAFGYGYNQDFTTIDRQQPDAFVWITGDSLCSPDGPCRAPQQQPDGAAKPAAVSDDDAGADGSEVHGLQGLSDQAFDELTPKGAFSPYPQKGEPYPAAGPDQSYLIDADINVKPDGTAIDVEFTRNDATRIGDVAIYPVCATPPAPVESTELLPVIRRRPIGEVPVIEGHDPVLTHATIASHGATSSHFRIASHNPWWSHDRLRSHGRWQSHDIIASRPIHRPIGSWHRPYGSYHRPIGSWHFPRGSYHRPIGSYHRPIGSWHRPAGSIHLPHGSIHRPIGSWHRPIGSVHKPPGSIHRPIGSWHKPPGSVHRPIGSFHKPPGSVHRPPGSHVTPTHRPVGSHVTPTHRPIGSHVTPTHRPKGSNVTPTHRPVGSHVTPTHRPKGSTVTPTHRPVGSHVTPTHRPKGSNVTPTHRPAGSSVKPVHRPAGSGRVTPNPGKKPVGVMTKPHKNVHKAPVIHKSSTPKQAVHKSTQTKSHATPQRKQPTQKMRPRRQDIR